MKTKCLILLFLVLMVFHSGCGTQNNNNSVKNQSILENEENTPISIKDILEFYDSSEYQMTRDSARLVLSNFHTLFKAGRYSEAIDLYLRDKGAFLVAFETTTETYEYHMEVLIPLISHTK